MFIVNGNYVLFVYEEEKVRKVIIFNILLLIFWYYKFRINVKNLE